MTDKISFRWLGVAGIEINIDGSLLAIDPLFSRPPLNNLIFGRVTPNPSQLTTKTFHYDAILVTHAHYDHILDVPLIAKQCGAQVYGSKNVCQLIILLGVSPKQVHEIHPGSIIQIATTKVTVLPGSHIFVPGFYNGKIDPRLKPPLHLRDYRMDQCYSYLIDTGSTSILDWCGTNADSMVEADLIFAGWGSEAYMKRMLELSKPCLFIPIHWDHFFQPLDMPIKAMPFPPAWLFPTLHRKNPLQTAHRLQKHFPYLRVLIPERFKEFNLQDLL